MIKLLADETFQDEVRKSKSASAEERKRLMHRYGVSIKELAYANKLLDALRVRSIEPDTEEIAYALARLKFRVGETSKVRDLKISLKEKVLPLFIRVAAVLAFPLLLTSIYFFYQANQLNSITGQEQILENYNTFYATPGAKTQVALPDGSLVWLNSGSSLRCPVTFGTGSRQVELYGEAYFEVAKNEQAPMVISTQHLKVKVYGTKFNVNAFADNGEIETTLVEGKVTLIPADSKKEYEIKPGFTASYAIQDHEFFLKKVENMDAFTGWIDGKLIFNDEHFTDIVRKLERWYNVDIKLTDPTLRNYTLYATFIDENIEQILDIFSSSIPITITYKKRIKQSDNSYSKRQIIIGRDQNKK